MTNGWGDGERSGRLAVVLALGGSGTALLSTVLAGADGGPYLSGGGVSVWIVTFAAGLMAALFAFPFGLEARLHERFPDRDKRWEVSLVSWGAAALVLGTLAFIVGFDTSTLGGALGVILAIESALVVGTVIVWLLAGG